MANTKIKPKLSYTLICDDVRQEVGGKFSLMGLFESISAMTFPAMHHRFAVVNEWTGGQGEFAVKIRLLAPDREQILSESIAKLILYSPTQRHRDVSIRYNETFKVPGTYWVETLIDDEPVGLTPLPVQMVAEQTVH